MTELPKSLPKKTYEGELESEIVMIKITRCKSWLGSNDTYDEPIGNLDKMEDEVGNPNPQSTPQVLPSFEVEPLDETQLENFSLNTYNQDIPLSSREVPSFDELEIQPKPLPNCPFLDVISDKEMPGSS
ncbi:hypothetical protein Tco_1493451 [Tanacetum coccineum]